MLDVDGLFPARDEPDEAHAAAIAAVCVRLGGPAARIDEDGTRRSIVGGAIDGDRIAWVEQRWRDEGYEDIEAFTLSMAVGGERVRTWDVETYNPWFGCDVQALRWIGDEVLAIYSEKHHTIACVVGRVGAPRLRVIDRRWQLLGDTLLYAGESRGLVERVRVPTLERVSPVAIAGAARDLAAGTSERCPLGSAALLQRQIAGRLPAIRGATAALLIGALAYRFWDDSPPVSASYDEAYGHCQRWNTPCWLPFHVVSMQGEAEARALGAELAAVAERQPAAYGPEEAAAEHAARHIAARCGDLVTAWRAGHLPEGTACYFWEPWSQAAFAGSQALFPAGMWAAWTALRPHAEALRARR